jgi:hypothetical protein
MYRGVAAPFALHMIIIRFQVNTFYISKRNSMKVVRLEPHNGDYVQLAKACSYLQKVGEFFVFAFPLRSMRKRTIFHREI